MMLSPSKGTEGGGSDETAPALSPEALSMMLFMNQLRTQVLVGIQLATRFPEDEAWWNMLQDRDFVESLNELASIMNDISADSPDLTPQAVAAAASNHYARAVEAVELVAGQLEVSPHELLSVLSNVS